MTRQECERALLDIMDEAWAIFREYDPKGVHLSMYAGDDGRAVHGYRDAEDGKKIILDGYLSPSGDYRFSR